MTYSMHLSWPAIPGLDTSQPAVANHQVGQQIEIERSDDQGGHFHHVVYVDGTATSYDDKAKKMCQPPSI
jgi:hypothetical protein